MQLPARLGKYTVQTLLGRGSMGVVYRGYDPVIKRAVAIKTIRKELLEDGDRVGASMQRFRQEAQAAGQFSHPNIVSVYEYWEDENQAFIAMEYVDGVTLRDCFARGAVFSENAIISLSAQLLEALAHAHASGIWHRDIKPANLIVATNGKLKLADFGVARVGGSGLTKAGSVIGTLGYVAPEFFQRSTVDHRCDLFSAAAVIYELLTGKPAFQGGFEAIVYQVCYEHPAPPSHRADNAAWRKYDRILARALAKAPVDRFQSAADFKAALTLAYAAPVTETIEAASPAMARPSDSPDPQPTLDPSTLREVEQTLAGFIGPVAKLVVQRAATQTHELQALVEHVAAELPDPAERQAFLIAARRTSPRSQTPSGSTLDGSAIPVHVVDRAVAILATEIGPIARVVVRRAAARSRDVPTFVGMLTTHLEPGSRARVQRDLDKLQ